MFSQKIIERIQFLSRDDIQDRYVVDVMNRFCRIALSEQIPLAKKIEHVETVLEFLDLFKEFEHKENQETLVQIQKDLFHGAQSNKITLNMAIAMNTIIGFLKKGREDRDALKFYAGVEAAIDYLDDRRKKLIIAANVENYTPVSVFTPGFFSSNQQPENLGTSEITRTKNPHQGGN